MPLQFEELFDLDVCSSPSVEVLNYFLEAIEANKKIQTAFLNTDTLFKAKFEPAVKSFFEDSLVLPDGQSIVLGSQLAGKGLIEQRVSGPDLFQSTLGFAEKNNYGVFFLGTRQEILEDMIEKIHKDFPQLDVSGYRNGFFDDSQASEVVKEANASEADILFLGLPFEKRMNFIRNHRSALRPYILMGVGGAFDVFASAIPRAPQWMQSCGLEWLHRLSQEPGRLWKRYLWANSYYFWLLIREFSK